MAIKIYTKTGDKGATSLLGGTKVSKADMRIEAYGTVDELNAHIGLCSDLLQTELPNVKAHLQQIQDSLFVAGALLACDPDKELKMPLPVMQATQVTFLESQIDAMESSLPPLKQFILPGGHITVSQLHIARCVCRRAERCCVRLQEFSDVEPLIIQYLNRLSDYFFVLARYAAQQLQVQEIPWTPSSTEVK